MPVAIPNSPNHAIQINMEYRKYEVWHDEKEKAYGFTIRKFEHVMDCNDKNAG